ncbi:hypothetical protein BDR22DRAFT_967443 [Usnea florida]
MSLPTPTPAPARPKILFAGLGAMGSGMATHLLTTSIPLLLYDPYPPTLPPLIAHGGVAVRTPREAVTTYDIDVVILMVVNSAQVEAVLFGEGVGLVGGLVEKGREGKEMSIVVCSTVAPEFLQGMQGRLRVALRDVRVRVNVIDAPVSGGVGRAREGTLSMFVSWDRSNHPENENDNDNNHDNNESGLKNKVRPATALEPTVHTILHHLSDTAAQKLYLIPGALGAGSTAKLIHQIFAGVHIALVSEALGLAAIAGLDTRRVLDEVQGSEGASWIFGNRGPYLIEAGRGRYSAVSIIEKDVGIVMSMAREAGYPLPVVGVAGEVFRACLGKGWGGEDDVVAVRLYLPDEKPSLVRDRAGNAVKEEKAVVSVSDIVDLLIGVHFATISEAMTFSERLAMDVDLMCDIVKNAAGGSAVFEKYSGRLKERGWRLTGLEDVRDRLTTALTKASALKYPLFLSSVALQEFNRQLIQ